MQATHPTLLDRLRRSDDREAWDRFVALSTPLLVEWTRRNGIPHDAAGDIVQNVLVLLVKRIPQFSHTTGRQFSRLVVHHSAELLAG